MTTSTQNVHTLDESTSGTVEKLKTILEIFVSSFHLRYRLANLICRLIPSNVSGWVRARAYRLAGFRIGHGTFLAGELELIGGSPFYERLEIGSECVVGQHVTISLDADVELGPRVSVGPFVRIYSGTHQIGLGSMRRRAPVLGKPVKIESGAWIGLSALVLPGVTIGRGSIVAAGAVVTNDVPPNTYVEGNPARVMRDLPWGDR